MILDDITTSLWPYPKPEPSSRFSQQDTEEKFKENLAKLGPTWHYATKEVYYERNSLGYRTKELDYFKGKDFALVLGASATEGIGLAEDEIWHAEIKRQFGWEILNAGFTGAGPDIQLMNTMLFLRTQELCPKAVVIQWPHLSRFMFKGDSLKRLLVPNLNQTFTGIKGDSIWERFSRSQRVLENFYKYWLYDNNDLNNSNIYVEVTRLMWTLANVPYYDFTMNIDDSENIGQWIDDLRKVIEPVGPQARDLQHDGPEFNLEMGKIICNKIRSML